jgi:hypothetical protein
MLSESNLIDQVNPFLENMPGAWSNPYPFDGYMNADDESEEMQDPSPACDVATTAGDKQIDWCKPGVPNCPMSRELEPTQKVNPDISYEDRGDISFGNDTSSKMIMMMMSSGTRKLDLQVLINCIIVLICIILAIKLTERL